MKIHRNQPCPCGSRRKYKKCCGKAPRGQEEGVRTMNGELKNDFRDEVVKQNNPIKFETEKVGEEEMLRRDSYVSMRQLEVQERMMAADAAHTQSAIETYEKFLEELSDLPLSEGRIGVVSMIQRQVKMLQDQLAKSTFPRVNKVTLEALKLVIHSKTISVDKAEPGRDKSVTTELNNDVNSDEVEEELTADKDESIEEAI